MSDPYPIFHEDVDEELVKRVKEQEMSIRLKLVAINYWIEKKKALDGELQQRMQELIRENEDKKLEILKKENDIVTGVRYSEERI